MKTGILGQHVLTANTEAVVYTVPAENKSSITINVCNDTITSAKVRVYLSESSGAVTQSECVDSASVPSYGVLERGGIIIGENTRVIVTSSVSGVSVNIWGYEE